MTERREGLISSGDITPAYDLIPRPDPTRLTTEAVERATDQFRRELAAIRELIEARLTAMDAAYAAHLRETGAMRRQLEEKITHLQGLHQEKFDGIDRRLEDRDERAALHAETGEKALNAALDSAQKLSDQHDKANDDAIRLAQTATAEQIRALEAVATTGRDALQGKIDDVRDRITVIESLTRGIKEASGEGRTEQHAQRSESGQAVIMVIMAVSVLIALVSVIAFVLKK